MKQTLALLRTELAEGNQADLTLRMSALFFLGAATILPPLLQTMVFFGCTAVLLFPGTLKSGPLWGFVCLATACHIIFGRGIVDNHRYLICYWAFVCFFVVDEEKPRELLRHNARWLVGLLFCIATIWKFIPGEFLNGVFFHASYLTDSRFDFHAALLGGLSYEAIQNNHTMLDAFALLPGANSQVVLNSNAGVHWLAVASSYWTVFIEGSIGICFVSPAGSFLYRQRHKALITFLLTTYFLAPVHTFGVLLSLLGLTDCDKEDEAKRLIYLGVFLCFIFLPLLPFIYRHLSSWM